MSKQRRTLTDDERQRVVECIHKGWKYEVIAAIFDISPYVVVRVAQANGITRNADRIAQRAAVRREVEALILQGLSLRKVAAVSGCTFRMARRVQTYMRQVAWGKEVKYT